MASTVPVSDDQPYDADDIRAQSALSDAPQETVVRHGAGDDTFHLYTAEARFMREAIEDRAMQVTDVQRDDAGYIVALTAVGPAQRLSLVG